MHTITTDDLQREPQRLLDDAQRGLPSIVTRDGEPPDNADKPPSRGPQPTRRFFAGGKPFKGKRPFTAHKPR